MKATSVNYKDGLLEDLANSDEAVAYLNAALEDGSQEVFLLALRDVAEAKGMSKLAQASSLNRENMYRMLSVHSNPQLSSLKILLEAMGLKLTVETKGAMA